MPPHLRTAGNMTTNNVNSHSTWPRVNATEAAEFTCVMSTATATTVDQQKHRGSQPPSKHGVLFGLCWPWTHGACNFYLANFKMTTSGCLSVFRLRAAWPHLKHDVKLWRVNDHTVCVSLCSNRQHGHRGHNTRRHPCLCANVTPPGINRM